MKKLLLHALFCVIGFVMHAQQNPALKGKVVDSKSQKPLQNVEATIKSSSISVVTNAQGNFEFKSLPRIESTLIISYSGYKTQNFTLEPSQGETIDLGTIFLEEDITSELQLSLVTITEGDLGDENTGSESTSGLLQASRDTYQQAAAFNWGQARFRVRGLDNEYGTTMINGVAMNKIYDGRPQWSNWGGLNDATRNQEFTMGTAPSDYTFGGILGTQEINTRASHYRTGTRLTFSGANTNYSWRAMVTHASGFNKKGWAFVVSGSRRWAEEGYFDGTDYSANSLFASVEKKINEKHSLNFTSIYAQNSRGKNSPNTQEVIDLMGENYNSYWGWQDGKKRNSRDKNVEEPINMLSHYWKINEKVSLNTNVAVQTGYIGNTRIDFQGVSNPDPTYYRNLPSYFINYYENDPAYVSQNAPEQYLPGGLGGVFMPNYALAVNAPFYQNQQLDWNNMYRANTTPIIDENNVEIGRAPSQSKYVWYEDRTSDTQWTANSILKATLSDHINMNAAVNYKNLRSHNYQYLRDLLGGAYFVDIDNFGNNSSQQQTDLNNPNRTVGVGDKYGYNYKLYANVIDAFTQFKFNYNKIDFYLSQSFTRSEYQREGLYRNGYYPTSSFGKSEKVAFDNFGFKGGATYKFTGRHMLDANAVYMSVAPTLRNAFPNARLNNFSIPNLESQIVAGGDLSYIIRAPKFKSRLTAFYSKIKNATEVGFFFAEGTFEDLGNGSQDTNGFVNEVVTGLDKQNAGLELGMEYQLTSTIKVMASGSYGQYIYTNNPNVNLVSDRLANANNVYPAIDYGQTHLKDYKQPGMPQQAASIGIEYRDPHFWWIGANYNYLGGSYLDISPILRTNSFLRNPASANGSPFPEITEERTRELLKQEQFDDIYLLNLQGGKSWRVSSKNRNTFGFFASINNVFDLRYKTGGYEQARNANYREYNQDAANGTPSFGAKYFYAYGRNYFVNFYFNF